ncbi:MAG: porin [Desulfobacterales bacterium]|nr:porin [Desulfobacterales bacterium]
MRKWIKICAAVTAALALSLSAHAAEWNFYGSARMETFFEHTDNVGSTETTYDEDLQSNARIGAKVRVNDSLKGRFEYGTKEDAQGTRNANIRLLWGEWDFGGGKLMVGQSYTPIYTSYSKAVYDSGRGLEKYGAISASRQPMIRLTMGGFQVAIIEPANEKLVTTDEVENNYPKVEAAYRIKFNSGSVKFVGGFNSYELNDVHDVDSYVVGVGGKMKFSRCFIAGSVYIGQNLGTYKFKTSPGGDPLVSGNNLIDSDDMGITLVTGYKVNDMFSFEAGYGYIESELDQSGYSEDDATHYYIQSQVTLAPGVYIVPEIGMVDEGEDQNGAEEKEVTYYGAKWQINF